jgi:hypothetical protein
LKKLLAAFLFCLALSGWQQIPAQEFEGPITEPLPYEDVEFPDWAHDVRRFEVIFFGSVPLTYILTNLVYDVSVYGAHNFERDYAIGTQRDQKDIKFMLLTSVSISAGIAVLDYIIGQAKDRKEKRQTAEEQNNNGNQ